MPSAPLAFIARSMQEALSVLLTVGRGVDIAELCGGVARTTTVAIRRNLVGGKNFDLVTHTDLDCPREQKATLRYLDEAFVLVLVMAPSCLSMGTTSHVNHSQLSDVVASLPRGRTAHQVPRHSSCTPAKQRQALLLRAAEPDAVIP